MHRWDPPYHETTGYIISTFLKYAESVKDDSFVKRAILQNLKSNNPGIRGGITVSHPIWGCFIQFSDLNWAAKYFADALILQESDMRERGLKKIKNSDFI